jgi:hypothetical protein
MRDLKAAPDPSASDPSVPLEQSFTARPVVIVPR